MESGGVWRWLVRDFFVHDLILCLCLGGHVHRTGVLRWTIPGVHADDWGEMKYDFGKVFASMFNGSMAGKGAMNFALMSYAISHAEPWPEDPERLVVEMNALVMAT